MTGEITLRGKVLAIGGLKEKSLAAIRVGIKDIVIPKDNERDLEKFPEELKNGARFFPVQSVEEVFEKAFEKKTVKKSVRAKSQTVILPTKLPQTDGVRC